MFEGEQLCQVGIHALDQSWKTVNKDREYTETLEQEAGSHKHSNEPLGSIRCRNFLSR